MAVEVRAGLDSASARLSDGTVRGWGLGTTVGFGPSQFGNIGDNETPATAGDVPIGAGVSSLITAAYATHNCIVTDTGAVRCWANNSKGQLGMGNVAFYGDQPGETPAAYGDLSVF